MDRVANKINIVYGMVVTILTMLFGEYWFLFAGFLILNLFDYMTGWCKAKFFNKNESSQVGLKGIVKKVMYWVVIAVAFGMAVSFGKIGETIDVELGFVIWFGWLTLATFIINEIRSILENLVEMDIKVPSFLIDGLEIAEKTINKVSKKENNNE